MGLFDLFKNPDKGGRVTTPPMQVVKSKYPPKKTVSAKPPKKKSK